ncbi:MAG: hypothetical protein ACFE0J_19955, partial [Elainellaceae cyanobacterium]
IVMDDHAIVRERLGFRVKCDRPRSRVPCRVAETLCSALPGQTHLIHKIRNSRRSLNSRYTVYSSTGIAQRVNSRQY